jgi:hypothetical protein
VLTGSSAEQVKASRSASQHRSPRPNKRKAQPSASNPPPEPEESDFEQMAVDEDDLATPDRSDQEATDFDSDDLDAAQKVGPRVPETAAEKAPDRKSDAPAVAPSGPPPRRELPFGRMGGNKKQEGMPGDGGKRADHALQGQAAQHVADDDETSDDEL